MKIKPFNDAMDLVSRGKTQERRLGYLLEVVERTDLTFKQKCEVIRMVALFNNGYQLHNRPFPSGMEGDILMRIINVTDTWESVWHHQMVNGVPYCGLNPVLKNASIICR